MSTPNSKLDDEIREAITEYERKRASERAKAVSDNFWSEHMPQGRDIFYEGDNPEEFAKLIEAEFGFNPASDPMWIQSYGFHCPPEHLDAIYGSGHFPMGS